MKRRRGRRTSWRSDRASGSGLGRIRGDCEARHKISSQCSLIIAFAGGPVNSVALDPAPVAQSQHKPPRLSVTHKQAVGLSLALLVATIALYFPVLHHPFTNIDDQGYVEEPQMAGEEGMDGNLVRRVQHARSRPAGERSRRWRHGRDGRSDARGLGERGRGAHGIRSSKNGPLP